MAKIHRLRPANNNKKRPPRSKFDDPDADLRRTDWLFALIAVGMLCIQWFTSRGE